MNDTVKQHNHLIINVKIQDLDTVSVIGTIIGK